MRCVNSRLFDVTDSGSRYTRVKFKLIASYLYLLLAFLSQMLLTPVLINNLGVEAYGIWTILMSIQTYLFVADAGFSSSVTTYVNIYLEENDRESIKGVISSNVMVLSLLFLVVAFFSCLFVELFFLYPIDDGNSNYNWLLYVFLLVSNVYLLSISGVLSNLVIARHKIEIAKSVQIAHLVFYTLVIFLVISDKSVLEDVLYVIVVSSLGYTIFLYFYCRKSFFEMFPTRIFLFDRAVFTRMSGFIVNTFVIGLTGRVQFYTDVLLVGYFMTLADVAYLEITSKLPFYATFIFSSLVAIYYPIFTERFHKGELIELRRVFVSVNNFSVGIAFSVMIVLMLYGEFFIDIWVGEEKFAGFDVFIVMVFTILLHAVLGPVSTLMQAIGDNRQLMFYEVIISILNVCISIALIEPLGLLGVVLGTFISLLFGMLVFYIRLVKKVLNITLSEYVQEIFVFWVVFFSISGGFFYITLDVWAIGSLWEVLLKSSLIFIVNFVLFALVDRFMRGVRFKNYLFLECLGYKNV